jgi:hypothetical protein
VQEFWICEACKSMNRAGAERCYHCRAPRSRATMATVHERHLAGMVMPGTDRLDPGEARGLLSQHEYTTAWPLGYAAALLLIPPMLFQAGLMGCAVVLLMAVLAPWAYSLSDGWWVALAACGAGLTFSVVVAAVVHSAFLWLTDGNIPSLGGGSPRFAPWRAALWWIESALWAVRAGAVIWIPISVGDRFGLLVGPFSLVLTFSLMWLAIWLFGSPLYSLRKPARLLEDLTSRLALPGSSNESLPGLWSASWSTARAIDALSPLVVLLGSIVILVSAVVQQMRMITGSTPAAELDFMSSIRTLAVLLILLALIESIANMIALALLARLTASLSGSQRTRRRWMTWSAGWSQGRPPSGQRPPSGYRPPAPAGLRPPVEPPRPAGPAQPGSPLAGTAPYSTLARIAPPAAQTAVPFVPEAPPAFTSEAELSVPERTAGMSGMAEAGPAQGPATGDAPRAHSWPAPLLPQSPPRWIRTQQVAMTVPPARPSDRPEAADPAVPGADVAPTAEAPSAASGADAAPDAAAPDQVRDWPEGI